MSMRIPRGERGWRSARGAPYPDGVGPMPVPALPAPAAPGVTDAGTARRGRPAEPVPTADAGASVLPPMARFPWQGVEWSVPYVAFLAYIFVIISYRFPIGQAAMIVALLTLPLSESRLRFPPLLGWLTAFFVIAAIGYRLTQFKSYTWEPLIDLGKYVLIVFVAVNVLNTRARIRFFIFFVLAVFAYYPVRGAIFNFFIYRASTQGRFAWNYVFSNPNDLAALLFLPFGLALGVLLTETDKWVKRAAMVGVAALPLIMFLAQSRGAIIALFVAGLVMFLSLKRRRGQVLLGAIAVGAVLMVFAPDSVWERLGALKSATGSGDLAAANDNNSARQRYEIWKVSTKVISDYPITGVGWDAYPNAHAVYARMPQFDPIARGARDSHNTYLNVTAENGIPGFLAFIGMVAAAVIPAIRARRLTQAALPQRSQQIYFCLLALLAYGVAGMFGSYQRFALTYIHLVLLWALAQQALTDLDRLRVGASPRRVA
jgi:O-antigen ligase